MLTKKNHKSLRNLNKYSISISKQLCYSVMPKICKVQIRRVLKVDSMILLKSNLLRIILLHRKSLVMRNQESRLLESILVDLIW